MLGFKAEMACDSEADDRIESSSSDAGDVIGRALGRRERLSTRDASVSAALPGQRSVESVPDDVSGTDFSL